MKIKIFVTGGTLDKEYNELNAELVFKETHIPEMIDRGRCRVETDIKTLMLIDSLDMTDKDRKLIRESCKNIAEDRIIVTHGTDTMVETAKVLAKEIKDKTIVLTGAMIPYKIRDSDSLFNLGTALMAVQLLPVGVYIVMNGKYFAWNNVKKNKGIGEFVEVK